HLCYTGTMKPFAIIRNITQQPENALLIIVEICVISQKKQNMYTSTVHVMTLFNVTQVEQVCSAASTDIAL
ncbi:hypothetical protein, partial [Escherichia coli]|uniref:hypothetical protein n=1 Tax=Escherichia coli TaxID=562 RepID=UPI001BDCAB75